MASRENRRKHYSQEDIQKTYDDLNEREKNLLRIIDQIENKGRATDYFSKLNHYKDELENVTLLMVMVKKLLDRS